MKATWRGRLASTAMWAGMLAGAFGLAAAPADAAQNVAGQFDYYVLSLAWSPSYCAAAGKRANKRECGPSAHYGFIVHGLWPQDVKGYPESCPSKFPARVPSELGKKLYDIMPSMSLIGHEWRAHGTCTGLDQAAYFELLRKAREAVHVPKEFSHGPASRTVEPKGIEAAFLKANPGLQADGIAVTCQGGRIDDVRICLTKALDFRACPVVDAEACSKAQVSLPHAAAAD